MTTTVAYHRDGFAAARPAVNVKDHHSGMDFVIALQRLVGDPAVVIGESVNSIYPDDLRDAAYEDVCATFWAAAAAMAAGLGIGPIEQEGRSGGWLVLADGRDPQDYLTFDPDDADTITRRRVMTEWLAAYAQLAAWCEAEVRDAPARVARLAQDYAMDRLGYAAAIRHGWRDGAALFHAPVRMFGQVSA